MHRLVVGSTLLALALIGGLAWVACGGGGLEPKVRDFDLIMGEGEIIQEVDGTEQLTGEFHRWEPSVLVAFVGDTINLKVTNPRGSAHSFALPGFGVMSPRLEPRGGTATLSFQVDKAGVFPWMCALPYDPESGDCDLDHKRMVGQLIVLER